MGYVSEMKDKVLQGEEITRQEALRLMEEPLVELQEAADEIRRKLCGEGFDICTIVNGKCGRCSEDCKYCAQSAHYRYDCVALVRIESLSRYHSCFAYPP